MADNEEVLNRANSLMRPEGSPLGGRPEGERAYGSSPLGGRPEGERITTPSPLGGRRRRAFVAGPAIPKLEELVFPEAPPLEEDDLPVLTEVVSPEAAVSDAGPDRFDETLVAILVSDIAHSIEQQMSIELPMLIEASLLNAREELRAGIRTTMDLALRDFLARRRQLRLPLDEPNRDA
jgi:hypothetical protein